MDKKVLVCITSYNRPDALRSLVAALLENSTADIVIFDDKSTEFPSSVLSYTRVTVMEAQQHRGKAGFWQTYQDIFDYCKSHTYDYYIILPDDVEPCPDFVSKAIEAYDRAGCICLSPLLTNRSLLPGISRWGMKPIILRDWGYETSYFDCAGIMKRDFFEALNWEMQPIMPSCNPYRSSGVGRQITTRLQSAGKRMGHVRRTLLAMTDTSRSMMNAEERKRHPMYADWRDNEPCVDVHMAALWRDGHVLKTAESLLRQPELATLFVTLNNYTKEQEQRVKSTLRNMTEHFGKKVVIRKGTNAKGSNEKLSQLPKSNARYIAFADDDIIYAETHLMQLIAGVNIYNAACSMHGSILRRFPIHRYYFGDRQMFSCNSGVSDDVRCDFIGTGVAMLKREWFTQKELKALYADAPATSMDDIIISCLLSQKGIDRYVLEHICGFIGVKNPAPDDDYVYERYKNNDSEQVAYLNANYRRYN